MFLHHLYYIGL